MTKDQAPYITAMLAAQDALALFERHQHGRYLWQAWAHIREMERLFPAHAEARAKLLPGVEIPSLVPKLQAQLFSHLDGVFGDLQEIGEITSDAGVAQLKEALRIDGKRGPTYARTAQRQHESINQVRSHYGWLVSTLRRLKAGSLTAEMLKHGNPTVTAEEIYAMAAEKIGVKAHTVKADWLAYLSTSEGEEAHSLIEQARMLHKEIRRTKRKSAQGRRKPSKAHPHRKFKI
ncbi:hypothetical protein [Ralstonia chuxiongensis]|uniref:hypothetical protein n=1 Tax=Ralstonia chuxiongensis TaxID=2957504 RepID=UPI0028F52189|nr:hypothetical protein [Ralstonia chuxiongensis]CAJ0777789.1 hypothetical protein R8510_04410 [Ralstonia chuxiongensis]